MGSGKTTTFITLGIVAILIVSAAVFFTVKTRKSASDGVVIKVGDTTSANEWELVYKLTGHDILKEEGVHLKRIPGTSTSPTYMLLLSGQYDVASWAWMGWINVISRGGKIKAVYAPSALTKEANARSGILVLENSPIRTIKDLRGKTIAVNTLGLNAEYIIKLLLKKNGMTPDQVQLLQMPTTNFELALRSKQVDAAIAPSGGAWLDIALDRGGVRVVPGSRSREILGKDITTTAAGFREDFIREHPEAVRNYVTAVEKAKRIIWEAYTKDPEHVRSLYAEITREKGGNPKLAKFYYPTSLEATLIKDSDVQYWIDVLVEEGQLKPAQIKPSDIYTNEFNPFAVVRR